MRLEGEAGSMSQRFFLVLLNDSNYPVGHEESLMPF